MADRLRWQLIAVLVLAAIVSGVANALHDKVVGAVGFVVFLGGVVMYARWRRAAIQERRARVFDREAKTDETGTRTDQ
jgi:hypothetical protein